MASSEEIRSLRVRCSCTHGVLMHDRYGCGAFLGSVAGTAEQAGHCTCRRTRSGVMGRSDASTAAEVPPRLPRRD